MTPKPFPPSLAFTHNYPPKEPLPPPTKNMHHQPPPLPTLSLILSSLKKMLHYSSRPSFPSSRRSSSNYFHPSPPPLPLSTPCPTLISPYKFRYHPSTPSSSSSPSSPQNPFDHCLPAPLHPKQRKSNRIPTIHPSPLPSPLPPRSCPKARLISKQASSKDRKSEYKAREIKDEQ